MVDKGRSLCKCRILWYLQEIELVLHSLVLGPSPGAKARGDNTMGGGVDTGHESIYAAASHTPPVMVW